MEMKADTAHVLMSDVLRGHIPALEDAAIAETANAASQHVIVVAERLHGGGSTSIVGVLRGVLLGPEPEIEFRCEIKESFDIVEAPGPAFNRFELHHGERVVNVVGPFDVKAARIDEISVNDQLCTLGLHLVRRAPRVNT